MKCLGILNVSAVEQSTERGEKIKITLLNESYLKEDIESALDEAERKK